MYTFRPLSSLARSLILSLVEPEPAPHEEARITVNPIVSKFASWYEHLRNAMQLQEDEVILRATIERILKRRLLLGGNGEMIAESLVRELLWARYLPENYVLASTIKESIDLHLALRIMILRDHRTIPDGVVNEWTYDLMSSDIQYILNPKREKEIMANFMFHVLQDDVFITDDSHETKNAQIFMAVRKAFSRDDLAFLRYHLFIQYFGKLTPMTLDYTAAHFLTGYHEIIKELDYPLKERIYAYVKKRTAAFFVLEDILKSNKENLKTVLESEEELERTVLALCDARYRSISSKVGRAIIRSVFFILLTKVIFAFLVEGTYDRFTYGRIIWVNLILNISIPPLLMIVVGLFIRPPGIENSKMIYHYITQLLYEENPRLGNKLTTAKKQETSAAFHIAFNLLWLVAFVLSFGGMIVVLSKFHVNAVSQFVLIFFLAIVSFLAYRIALIANVYRVGDKQGLLTLLVDFLFMPVIRVGRGLSQNIAKVNFFLFIFDFFIEAPFKSLFAFFDQWFYFLHAKTEELE